MHPELVANWEVATAGKRVVERLGVLRGGTMEEAESEEKESSGRRRTSRSSVPPAARWGSGAGVPGRCLRGFVTVTTAGRRLCMGRGGSQEQGLRQRE